MTSRTFPRAVVAAACLLVLPSTAAAASPDAGEWTGPVVSFSVDAGGLLVSPTARAPARRRCRALSVVLGDAVRVRGGGFSARVAVGRRGRARLKGRFVSATSATGTLRVRGRRAGCRTRIVRWATTLTTPAAVTEPAAEEPAEEELPDEAWEDDEYAEDEESTDDDGDFWEEPTDEEIAAEGDPFE